eukprot:32539_1
MGITLDCCLPAEIDHSRERAIRKKRQQRRNILKKDFECKIIELNETHRKKCHYLFIDAFIKNKFDSVYYDLKNKQVFKTYINYYLSKSINTKNNIKSFVAVNKKNENQIVGVLICDNYSESMRQKAMKDLITRSNAVDDQYDKIFGLFSDIKDKYNKKTNNKYNVNDYTTLELKFCAVKSGYRRLGIMTKLVQYALNQAKALDYKECICIALNNDTINGSKKIGFNEQITVDLNDWKYKNNSFSKAVEKTNDGVIALMQIEL